MPLTSYMQKQVLDWWTGAAAATQPPARWLQFATGSPNDAGASDGPFTSRKTAAFQGAASPQGSASNNAAITGGSATAAGATVRGWNLYDSSLNGTRIMYGTTTVTLTLSTIDAPAIPQAGLTITIA